MSIYARINTSRAPYKLLKSPIVAKLIKALEIETCKWKGWLGQKGRQKFGILFEYLASKLQNFAIIIVPSLNQFGWLLIIIGICDLKNSIIEQVGQS